MRSKISPFTWIGLFISLFGFIALRLTFRGFGVSNSITAGVWNPDVSDSSSVHTESFTNAFETNSDWVGTFALRAGFAWKKLLFYTAALNGHRINVSERLLVESAARGGEALDAGAGFGAFYPPKKKLKTGRWRRCVL